MMSIWENNPNDNLTRNIYASIYNWENDIANLFEKNRISVFAASEYTSERIYLIWLDNRSEPEIWVYDTNGLSRFKNLCAYLKAYLDDDITKTCTDWC